MNVTNSSIRLDVGDTARAFIRWVLYPLIWAWVIGCIAYVVIYPDTMQMVLALK